MKDHASNMAAFKRILPKVLKLLLSCYDGDCFKCANNSAVCHGGVANHWWSRSMFLSSNRIHNLSMNENDKVLLLEILKCVASVEQLKLYTDTQKCEAVICALSVSLPKNVNFSATMEGRGTSAIHRVDNDPGTSTI